MEELKEFVEALAALKQELRGLREQERATNDAMHSLLNSSHLRSTLTLLKDDIALRRTLELLSHD